MSDLLDTRHYDHQESGLSFYEARDALGELCYVQQYDPETRRGVGARVSFWTERDVVCTAKGYAIEEVPGLPGSAQWHGQVDIQGSERSFSVEESPLTEEVERCIQGNSLETLESSIAENQVAIKAYFGENNPDTIARLKTSDGAPNKHRQNSSYEP